MTKTAATYWNPLAADAGRRWTAVPDASRRAFEIHGPFRTEEGAVVLEVSFPSRVGEI